MKILLIGINAKYIHPNLAIRLLKKNTTYDCDLIEFTIKDSISHIVEYIIDNGYNIVAFSTYIWNVNMIKSILQILKNKNIIIILGGPEVSYNAKYYLDNNLAQYVIKNEGEEAFNKLLHYLDNKEQLNNIPNLYYKNGFTFDKLVDLKNIKMAYDLLDDVKNKIIYLETSRGCPYHCGYCMASLDNKVRFFNIDEIKDQILKLNSKGAKVYKFLDRTFNANKKNFISLIDFIIENHIDGQSYQFEITGDLLDEDVILYINNKAIKNLFRFEIGIQSTNIKTNLSVGRIQNNEKLFNNIRLIQKANIIDLHLDLIAGLPYEDYKSFEKTFNDVISLRPKELQLGFLKLLYGTNLYKTRQKYGYIYQADAPYEVIENEYLSKADIAEIHITEDAFESYYNSNIMPNAIKVILDNEVNPFEFFHSLGKTSFKNKGFEHLYKNIDEFISNRPYYNEFHQEIIYDYLNYFNLKPKAWWNEKPDKKDKNKALRFIYEVYNLNIELIDLYKYSILVSLNDCYILAIYKPKQKQIYKLKKGA